MAFRQLPSVAFTKIKERKLHTNVDPANLQMRNTYTPGNAFAKKLNLSPTTLERPISSSSVMAHRTLSRASLKNQTAHYSPKTLAAFADTYTGGTKRGWEVDVPTLL